MCLVKATGIKKEDAHKWYLEGFLWLISGEDEGWGQLHRKTVM